MSDKLSFPSLYVQTMFGTWQLCCARVMLTVEPFFPSLSFLCEALGFLPLLWPASPCADPAWPEI